MTQRVLHILSGESGASLQERGLDTYPSVYNALYVLHKQGWENHLATAADTSHFGHLLHKVYRLSSHPLQKAWQLRQIKGHFDMALLYEPRDVKLYQLAKWLGINLKARCHHLVHHCLEVPVQQLQGRGWRNAVHRHLYQGYRDISHVIIQDATRHALLRQHCHALAGKPTHYVPNAYIPTVEPMAGALPWFDQIRQQSSTLVSYVGALEGWALSPSLFQAIAEQRHLTFLFSGWSNDGFAATMMERYAACPHIHFHLGKKSLADLNYIVKHSDIGLVFYDSTDPNINEIGQSSGKLHKYLSFAKPVLTNNIPSLSAFLQSNRFGIAAEPAQFGAALDMLAARQAFYTQHIAEHYPKLIQFERSYQSFLAAVQPHQDMLADARCLPAI